jgi:hypothetical protein
LSTEVRYLDLADYLYLAGAALDMPPEAVFDVANLHLADAALHAQPVPSTESSSIPTSWPRRQSWSCT